MKRFLASLTVIGLIVAGGAGAAWAGGSGSDQTTTTESQGGPACPQGYRGAGVVRLAFKTSADTIGVTTQDLKTAIKAGRTIADVARDHGVDPQKVVDAIVVTATQQIDQAVAAGTIPAQRSDQVKSKLPDLASRLVNETQSLAKAGSGRGRGHGILKDAIKVAADTIHVSADDLTKALDGGKTIADVAKDHHVDVSKVVDAVVKSATKQIDQAVSAGTIDKDRATKLKQKLPDLVGKFVRGERAGKHAGNGRRCRKAQGLPGERGPGNTSPPTTGPTNQGA